MQSFALNELMEKEFARKHQMDMRDVAKVNIKDDFVLKMKSGITMHIPLDEIETIARPACLACVDFANEYADIAVGGLGSPDGCTTTLIRTIGGKRVFTDAVRRGYVEELREGRRTKNEERRTSEERAEKARIMGLIETAAEKKRSRGEKRLSQLRA